MQKSSNVIQNNNEEAILTYFNEYRKWTLPTYTSLAYQNKHKSPMVMRIVFILATVKQVGFPLNWSTLSADSSQIVHFCILNQIGNILKPYPSESNICHKYYV